MTSPGPDRSSSRALARALAGLAWGSSGPGPARHADRGSAARPRSATATRSEWSRCPITRVYTAFVPHAFVASWSKSGEPVAAMGTQLSDGHRPRAGFPVRFHHRLAKRERRHGAAQRRLRFLPLHTAFEGYLALHFRGPDVAWKDYSEAALREGLSPRIESVTPSEWIEGLEDALRTFEILEGQVGVLVFVADALAAAFVVPHPDDYRRLHRSLLGDCYGELIYRYSLLYDDVPALTRPIPDERVSSLADLGRELARMRADWAAFLHSMADGLIRPADPARADLQARSPSAVPVPARILARRRKPHRRADSDPERRAGLPQDLPALGRAGPARLPARHPGPARLGARRGRLGVDRVARGSAPAPGSGWVRGPAPALNRPTGRS